VSAKRDIGEDVDAVAATIIDDVRRNGDQAVAAYTEKFDRLSLIPGDFAVDPRQIDEAVDACDQQTIEALQLASMCRGGRPHTQARC
jgi:histidinol dehydrogenase